MKIELNNEIETGLNPHSDNNGVVSHNKILSVNEFKIHIILKFFCSFPDKIL